MFKALLVFLTESVLVLPFPLYCIYEEMWGAGSGWLAGIGYVLAVPLLALYAGSFHGLAGLLYSNGLYYYLVSFVLTGLLCWLGLVWVDGASVYGKETWPVALGISALMGLLGLIPAAILRG